MLPASISSHRGFSLSFTLVAFGSFLHDYADMANLETHPNNGIIREGMNRLTKTINNVIDRRKDFVAEPPVYEARAKSVQ